MSRFQRNSAFMFLVALAVLIGVVGIVAEYLAHAPEQCVRQYRQDVARAVADFPSPEDTMYLKDALQQAQNLYMDNHINHRRETR